MYYFYIAMEFLWLFFKEIVLGVIITWCTIMSSFGQGTQAVMASQNIIAPQSKAVVFAPGVISTADDEWAPSFTPDGNTVYFSSGVPSICFSKRVNGQWTKPVVASFLGHWKDTDPFVSPDGKRLFFASYRPLDGLVQSPNQKNAHIWYVDHLSGDQWSAPHHLDAPINLEGINNYAPAVSRSGTLYFFAPGRDPNNRGKSYYAKWLGNHYDEPKLLSLNDPAGTKDPYIAPDESYIVFASANELYISFRKGDTWLPGQKLGPQVNSGDSYSSPYVSADGKTLYYSADHTHGILMIPVNISKNIN